MGKYQSYPDYSKTNNRWLDKIPSHWRITQIKHIVSTRVTDGPHSTPEFLDEGVPFVSAEAVSGGFINFNKIRGYISEKDDEAFSQKYRPQMHDVYMVKSGATTGVTAIVETERRFNIWSPLAVMRCVSTYNPYFLLNSLRSDYFQKSVQLSWTFGTQQNIGMGTLENLSVCYPPLEEQVQIANFLDHETAKIDTLIEKQQQLIKLLKEKRQAVISHAVTKGLNPQAPMKDSGVEWLGEVPEHWVVSAIKYVVSKTKDAMVDGPFGSSVNTDVDYVDEGVPVVRTLNITNSGFSPDNLKFMRREKFEQLKRHAVYPGDILFSKVGTIGNACILPNSINEAILSTTGSCKISIDINLISAKYLVLLIQSMNQELMQIANANVQPFLNMSNIKNLRIPLPSLFEQEAILESLHSRLTCIDGLILGATRFECLLKERRTALISAAVTGKIDVRNWQAPISQDQALEQTA